MCILSALTDTLERVYLEDGWQLAEKQSPHHDLHGEGMDTIEWPLYGVLDTRWDAPLRSGDDVLVSSEAQRTAGRAGHRHQRKYRDHP